MIKQRPDSVIDLSGGSNQSRVRAHNERLVLSLVRRHGQLAKSEIARKTGLSAQTVSVIMRSLESDGLLLRGEPQRGKVGQPSIPMRLDPNGVFSVGLNVGRRSADLILVDFLGNERDAVSTTYAYPLPSGIMDFATRGLEEMLGKLSIQERNRVAGIGVSMPFELWSWAEKVDAPQDEMDQWRDAKLKDELEAVTQLPVIVQNDATSACGAELVFGRGAELADFVYFFVGTFIGGGIVLNHSVYSGRSGNAGAFGPMPVMSVDGKVTTLIDHASVFALEMQLKKSGIDLSPLWRAPEDWQSLGTVLDDWIDDTAKHLAGAIVASFSIIDFQAAVVDGAFPADIRKRIVEGIQREITNFDTRGIIEPTVLEGKVGRGARALGGAGLPLFSRFLLDQSVLVKGL